MSVVNTISLKVKVSAPNYERRIKNKQRRNNALFIKSLQSIKDYESCPSDLRTKIKNFADRNGLGEKDVFDSMKNNQILACAFSYDALRQNVPERAFGEYMKQFCCPQSKSKRDAFRKKKHFALDGFRKMPQGGKGALLFYEQPDGSLRIGMGDAKPGEKTALPSIDFYGKYVCGNKKLRFYISHKYTKDDGGQQNSQFYELRTFVKETSKIQNENYAFIAVADGNYYIKPRKTGITRLDTLVEECSSRQVKACTSRDILAEIAILKYEWLMNKNIFPISERDATWKYEKTRTYRALVMFGARPLRPKNT